MKKDISEIYNIIRENTKNKKDAYMLFSLLSMYLLTEIKVVEIEVIEKFMVISDGLEIKDGFLIIQKTQQKYKL